MLEGHTAVPVTHVRVTSNNMLGITMQQLHGLCAFLFRIPVKLNLLSLVENLRCFEYVHLRNSFVQKPCLY